MKKILIFGLLFLTVFSQENKTIKKALKYENLIELLVLSPEQKEKIADIYRRNKEDLERINKIKIAKNKKKNETWKALKRRRAEIQKLLGPKQKMKYQSLLEKEESYQEKQKEVKRKQFIGR
jgi:Spy/CpxP family protein refolding chaperone